jgi:hypothetical protein
MKLFDAAGFTPSRGCILTMHERRLQGLRPEGFRRGWRE